MPFQTQRRAIGGSPGASGQIAAGGQRRAQPVQRHQIRGDQPTPQQHTGGFGGQRPPNLGIPTGGPTPVPPPRPRTPQPIPPQLGGGSPPISGGFPAPSPPQMATGTDTANPFPGTPGTFGGAGRGLVGRLQEWQNLMKGGGGSGGGGLTGRAQEWQDLVQGGGGSSGGGLTGRAQQWQNSVQPTQGGGGLMQRLMQGRGGGQQGGGNMAQLMRGAAGGAGGAMAGLGGRARGIFG